MEINIDQELLDEVNMSLLDLVGYMNLKGLDFNVIAFITQAISNEINKAQEKLDRTEN